MLHIGRKHQKIELYRVFHVTVQSARVVRGDRKRYRIFITTTYFHSFDISWLLEVSESKRNPVTVENVERKSFGEERFTRQWQRVSRFTTCYIRQILAKGVLSARNRQAGIHGTLMIFQSRTQIRNWYGEDCFESNWTKGISVAFSVATRSTLVPRWIIGDESFHELNFVCASRVSSSHHFYHLLFSLVSTNDKLSLLFHQCNEKIAKLIRPPWNYKLYSSLVAS